MSLEEYLKSKEPNYKFLTFPCTISLALTLISLPFAFWIDFGIWIKISGSVFSVFISTFIAYCILSESIKKIHTEVYYKIYGNKKEVFSDKVERMVKEIKEKKNPL